MALARMTLLLLSGAATAASAQQPEKGTFRLEQNGATIATETFQRNGESLETTLAIPGQVTFRTAGRLRGDGTLSRLEVRVFGPGRDDGDPIQTSAVVFADGTVTVEQPIGSVVGDPASVEPGAVPYLNPSPTFMEQILRRARAIGGDTVEVDVWTPGPGGGTVRPATVTFAGRQATLRLGGVAVEVTTDAIGRILAGAVPSQGISIIRR